MRQAPVQYFCWNAEICLHFPPVLHFAPLMFRFHCSSALHYR